VQRGLAPSQDRAGQGQVVAGQGRILGDLRHRPDHPGPVHVEPVEIERVVAQVLRGPDEQRVVDVEGLGQEGT